MIGNGEEQLSVFLSWSEIHTVIIYGQYIH